MKDFFVFHIWSIARFGEIFFFPRMISILATKQKKIPNQKKKKKKKKTAQ
jgi:hypothetical protein